jgi:cytochrome c oxidase assembly factor CtaG
MPAFQAAVVRCSLHVLMVSCVIVHGLCVWNSLIFCVSNQTLILDGRKLQAVVKKSLLFIDVMVGGFVGFDVWGECQFYDED